jgi:hypothetical protein
VQAALTLAQRAMGSRPIALPRPGVVRSALVVGLDTEPWIDRCITALGALGTVAEVQPLQAHASGVWPGARKQRAQQAIRAIQARVHGAEAGQVSLAQAEGGELSEAADPRAAGRLSVRRDRE